MAIECKMDRIQRRARFVSMLPTATIYVGLGFLFGFETRLIITTMLLMGQIAGAVIYWLAER